MVLKQLQHFLSYLQQFERVFIRRQIDTTLAERRYELSAKQKQIEKDEKRMDELDRLFRKIYEDNVSGKLNDERFYKLSDGYEAEQGQLKREIEALTAEVSQADMEVTNVAKLIAVTKKYTRIDELTPEILNAFVDKIVIHEREKKDGKRTQQIDIGIFPIQIFRRIHHLVVSFFHKCGNGTIGNITRGSAESRDDDTLNSIVQRAHQRRSHALIHNEGIRDS